MKIFMGTLLGFLLFFGSTGGPLVVGLFLGVGPLGLCLLAGCGVLSYLHARILANRLIELKQKLRDKGVPVQ